METKENQAQVDLELAMLRVSMEARAEGRNLTTEQWLDEAQQIADQERATRDR